MDDYTRRARKFLKNLDKKAMNWLVRIWCFSFGGGYLRLFPFPLLKSFVAKLATLLKPFEEHWNLFIGISAGLFLVGANFGLLWFAWLWGIPTFLSMVFLYLTLFLPCFRDDDVAPGRYDEKWDCWVCFATWLVILTWFFSLPGGFGGGSSYGGSISHGRFGPLWCHFGRRCTAQRVSPLLRRF